MKAIAKKSKVDVAKVLRAALEKYGFEADFSLGLASHSLRKLERMAMGKAGPWQYRAPAVNDRRHPVRKLVLATKRLSAAVVECERMEKELAPGEVNTARFLEDISAVIGSDLKEVLRIVESLATHALAYGKPRTRKGGRPVNLMQDTLILELAFILKSHDIRNDWEDNFLAMVVSCQTILPTSHQMSDMRSLQAAIVEARSRNAETIAIRNL